MKTMVYVLGGLLASVVVLAAVVALIGSRLPKKHVASRSIVLHQSPQSVYAVIRDFDAAPTWRSDVKRIEVETKIGGHVHFREVGKNGAVNYELAEDVPGQRMVTRILDTNLGYSGSWTYVLTPANAGTHLAITEDGEVSNPLFRFMSRYVFGNTATLDRYLTSLAKKFGETATPQ